MKVRPTSRPSQLYPWHTRHDLVLSLEANTSVSSATPARGNGDENLMGLTVSQPAEVHLASAN